MKMQVELDRTEADVLARGAALRVLAVPSRLPARIGNLSVGPPPHGDFATPSAPVRDNQRL
jgi:hypothetical protein